MGLRAVRWEFDFNDMIWLLENPESLAILATRMVPILEKNSEADK